MTALTPLHTHAFLLKREKTKTTATTIVSYSKTSITIRFFRPHIDSSTLATVNALPSMLLSTWPTVTLSSVIIVGNFRSTGRVSSVIFRPKFPSVSRVFSTWNLFLVCRSDPYTLHPTPGVLLNVLKRVTAYRSELQCPHIESFHTFHRSRSI